jgi:hypothetical protein
LNGIDSRIGSSPGFPARFLHHALVEDRYFCTLPGDFLDDVVNRVGTERFDPELVALERTCRPCAAITRRTPVSDTGCHLLIACGVGRWRCGRKTPSKS